MKKILACMLVLLTVSTVSFAAQAEEDLTKQIHGLLTEVYGYTQEEALTFNVHIAQEDDENWYMEFYLHPNWVYIATIGKGDRSFVGYTTPFSTLHRPKASENSVRYMLHAIEDNGWFTAWNRDSKTAFSQALDWCGDIRVNDSLRQGLTADDYTPAQALKDLFLSCYGEPVQWNKPIREWLDVLFHNFGLTMEQTTLAMPEGIINRTADEDEICEFVGEVPDVLTEAFSVSQLAGWECLAGAYRISDHFSFNNTIFGLGLAAFAKGDERLLIMLWQDAETSAWHAMPVSNTALLPDRDFYIAYVSKNNRFDIIYPISDTEQEIFECRLGYLGIEPIVNGILCELWEYRHVDLAGDRIVAIRVDSRNPFESYYSVTTTQSGSMSQVRYPALATNLLNYIEAAAFPKTEEACIAAAQEAPVIPEGYGVSSAVHLRADTSSHSTDLGMYRMGTLVEILDIQPGSAFPWVHVRIGQVEGYMSANYVAYPDNTQPSQRVMVQGMAKTKSDTSLKEKTNGLSQTVMDLPKGTVVRVLAEVGNWLQVSVPANETDWLMQPDEIVGYIKPNQVVQAATALQLSWLLPDE